VTVVVLAIATLFYSRPDLPKAERPGITPSNHGVGVLFGSPKYQVKGELVEGGFLDKSEVPPSQATLANDLLKAPSHGVASKSEQGGTE
jgi:hypothetical protein